MVMIKKNSPKGLKQYSKELVKRNETDTTATTHTYLRKQRDRNLRHLPPSSSASSDGSTG